MKPSKTQLNESKLTQQLKALAIARKQGAKFSRNLRDLTLDVEPEARDELVDTILEHRRQDRLHGKMRQKPKYL